MLNYKQLRDEQRTDDDRVRSIKAKYEITGDDIKVLIASVVSQEAGDVLTRLAMSADDESFLRRFLHPLDGDEQI